MRVLHDCPLNTICTLPSNLPPRPFFTRPGSLQTSSPLVNGQKLSSPFTFLLRDTVRSVNSVVISPSIPSLRVACSDSLHVRQSCYSRTIRAGCFSGRWCDEKPGMLVRRLMLSLFLYIPHLTAMIPCSFTRYPFLFLFFFTSITSALMLNFDGLLSCSSSTY